MSFIKLFKILELIKAGKEIVVREYTDDDYVTREHYTKYSDVSIFLDDAHEYSGTEFDYYVFEDDEYIKIEE